MSRRGEVCMGFRRREVRMAGFTIVESLVAVLILTVVAIAFVPLLNQGFSEVFLAGYRISALHSAQGMVDAVKPSEVDDEAGEFNVKKNITINIRFEDGRTIPVKGTEVERVEEFQGRQASITAFVPDIKQD